MLDIQAGRLMDTALQAAHDQYQDGDKFTVPMSDRVVLAFLARQTDQRSGDEELLDELEDPQSRQIGEAILHPDRIPASLDVGRKAIRFFLDASNLEDAGALRAQVAILETDQISASSISSLHAV